MRPIFGGKPRFGMYGVLCLNVLLGFGGFLDFVRSRMHVFWGLGVFPFVFGLQAFNPFRMYGVSSELYKVLKPCKVS